MFRNLGPMEILIILVIALLIFGPSKLPQLGKSVGDSIREFKKSVKSDTDEESTGDKPEDEKKA